MSAAFFLTFRAAEGRYAVPIEDVREAARVRTIAPLPGAPAEYIGVTLVRGEPVGVVDVARALGNRSATRPAGGAPLVVVLYGRAHALLVDRIDGVEEILPSAIRHAPPGARRLAGVVAEGSRFLSILDLDALFAGAPA